MSDLLDLASALVRIDTTNPPAGELRAAQHVAAFLDGAGADVQLQEVAEGRANLIARIRGTGERRALVFSGHLDTVPVGPDAWAFPPLDGGIRDGRLHGRGSTDMKGAVAAMTVVLRDLALSGRVPAGDVVLALTAGEEVDSRGAHLLARSGLVDDAGMLVVGEMTGLDVGCATKGLLWLGVETDGARGHGSIVGRAGNAIARGHDHGAILGALRARGGGVGAEGAADGAGAAGAAPAISIIREGQPVATAPEDPLVLAAVDMITEVLGRAPAVRGLPYLTDASAFVEALGPIPTIILGPGEQTDAHTVDETLAIDALKSAAQIYRRLADVLMYG